MKTILIPLLFLLFTTVGYVAEEYKLSVIGKYTLDTVTLKMKHAQI